MGLPNTASVTHCYCLLIHSPDCSTPWGMNLWACLVFSFSEREMGQREVWCNRAEYWGVTHGVQSSALCPDGSSASQTEGHGEGRHSKGTDVDVHFFFISAVKKYFKYRFLPTNFTANWLYLHFFNRFVCQTTWFISPLLSTSKTTKAPSHCCTIVVLFFSFYSHVILTSGWWVGKHSAEKCE